MDKCLHIISSSEVGGAQSWVKEQVSLFPNTKFFLVTNRKGWLTDNTEFEGCLFSSKIKNGFSISLFFEICKFIKTHDIRLVVASSANAGVYARLVKLFSDIRVIYISHGWSCVYNGGRLRLIYTLIERALSLFTDKIICVSNNDYNVAIQHLKISPSKLKVIRNGVSHRILDSQDSNTGKKDNEFKLLFLGRLSPPKRPDLLIESVVNMSNVTLDIVGGGDLLDGKAIPQNVQILGNIDSFGQFDRYHALCLISDSEGLPMSCLEAGVSGVPMIVSNVGGCPEVINGNGLVVDNDIESIRCAILELMSSYDSFKRTAEKLSPMFDINSNRDDYYNIYLNK